MRYSGYIVTLCFLFLYQIGCANSDSASNNNSKQENKQLTKQVGKQGNQQCQSNRVSLQMLGTRGPELWDKQASTSYLIWLDGRARLIVDAGAGSSQNFEASPAKYEDLSAILFTHFHIDHSADLINYFKGGFFTDRNKDLLIYGPEGNHLVSSADDFIKRLIGKKGVYPYFNDLFDTQLQSPYKVIAKNIAWSENNKKIQPVYENNGIKVKAVVTHHGPIPAVAYRVELAGCVISFTGDMSGKFNQVPRLAKGSDILVAHNVIPENATGVATRLHMKPSYIGLMAEQAGVKKLLLTHIMRRTVNKKEETLSIIRQRYKGLVVFPKDLQSFKP